MTRTSSGALKVLLVHHTHQLKILVSLWDRLIVDTAPVNTQESTLGTNTEFWMIKVDP